MLNFKFTILFWVITRTGLHAFNAQKSLFSYCTVLQHCIRPLSQTLCFSYCLFKTPLPNTQSPLIGQPAHVSASIVNKDRAAVLNEFVSAELAVGHTLCKCVTL